MPHTNRKKKSSSSTAARTSKPILVHTKRQEILDEEGWTHVVDTPRKRSSTLTKGVNGGVLQVGDFEINGVAYVKRTVEEMGKESEFWAKGWVEGSACRALGRVLREEVEIEEEEELKETEIVGDYGAVEEGSTHVEEPKTAETTEVKKDEESSPLEKVEDVKPAESNPEITENVESTDSKPEESSPAEETTPLIPQPPTQRRKVDNIIVLGLGSLRSARREGRRATLTQLAALQTIIKHFESQPENTTPLQIILQEPLFTETDITYLSSLPNFSIVSDPEAFSKVTEGSLVYAIHCYAQVYKKIAEGVKPAVLIGTDVGNFGRFNLSESADAIQAQLESLVEGCEIIHFPQVRHDFSDTKIYWRRDETASESALVVAVDSLSIAP